MPSPRLAVIVPTLVLSSALMAFFFFVSTAMPLPFYGDEISYKLASEGIAKDGIFSAYPYSELRTYLFPAMLAPLPMARWAIFALNLIVYELAVAAVFVFMVRRSPPKVNAWLYGLPLFFNPFALLYLGYALTEIASLSLTLVYALLLVWACNEVRLRAFSAFTAGLALGAAVMVRPSNLFLLVALPFLFASGFSRRALGERAIGLIAGVALLLAPQAYNNLHYHNARTPLVAAYAEQVQNDRQLIERSIKYATALSPDLSFAIPAVYLDPYREHRHSENPWVAMTARLAKLLTTVFALIDQDRPIPYNQNLFPWYRYPASALSIAMFYLGLVGVLGAFSSWRREAKPWREPIILQRAVFATIAFACLVAYSRFHTEARYGLPALVLISTFIPMAVESWSRAGKATRTVTAAGFVVWLVAGMSLTVWIERQILI